MNIPLLAPFEESDWESVATAFEHAPSLALGQAWREKPEENFRPGTVRIGWQPDALVILAAGDEPGREWLASCERALGRDESLGFAATWGRTKSSRAGGTRRASA